MNISDLENIIDKFIEDPTFGKLKKITNELNRLSDITENPKERGHDFCCSLVYDVICWSKITTTIQAMPEIKKLLTILKQDSISDNEFIDLRITLENLDLSVTPE